VELLCVSLLVNRTNVRGVNDKKEETKSKMEEKILFVSNLSQKE
jgi:hypothetical protein